MKLLTLNIWGGKLYDSLLRFVKQYSQEIDIFCFQEVNQASSDKLISRDMHADIYGAMAKILPQHTGYFAPHLQNSDLKSGLAIFIKKDIDVKECKDIFIYRKGFKLLNEDRRTIPRNLQYISFTDKNNNYLIGHFHGIWYPKTKVDTKDRIKQVQKIKKFLSARKERKILCGDFNLLPRTKSMQILEKGMINLISKYDVKTTRNKYYEREEKYADYILISPDIEVNNFKVVDAMVSDHSPLILEFN